MATQILFFIAQQALQAWLCLLSSVVAVAAKDLDFKAKAIPLFLMIDCLKDLAVSLLLMHWLQADPIYNIAALLYTIL